MKLLSLLVVLTSVSAFAGKPEREHKTTITEPKIKETVAAVKSSCGCSMGINVDWDSFKDVSKMAAIDYNGLEMLNEESKKFCTDKESKAVVCKIKTVHIAFGPVKHEFKNGTLNYFVDGQSSVAWSQIFAELDK
jgi:hypothetical protein